jgi:hypothetical protein
MVVLMNLQIGVRSVALSRYAFPVAAQAVRLAEQAARIQIQL